MASSRDPRALLRALLFAFLILGATSAHARVLIPMDLKQTDHLKAYGIAYWELQRGIQVEWLLNYRGGAFLVPEDDELLKECRIRNVRFEMVDVAQENAIYEEIEGANMDVIMLEKAPRVAIYIPPGFVPWDDAVTLAFAYAEIPYTAIWDPEVIHGDLAKYDWLHLHHEDFTGQYGKFYAAFHDTRWYKERVATYEASAHSLGFEKVSDAKKAVVETIRDWVARGGFLFAMCSATDTFDIALAAEGIDIAGAMYDGDGMDPNANAKLDFTRTLAFQDFALEMNPLVYEFSSIDMTRLSLQRGERNDFFSLFEFSAKQDPVPTMLTQNHTSVVKGFLGQTTSFNKSQLKDGVLVMGEMEGAEDARYIHGNFGKGTYTWLGGHDPEDWQHAVGDPPTNLAVHKNSPGYRLILNNVLFPAAEKKKQKT